MNNKFKQLEDDIMNVMRGIVPEAKEQAQEDTQQNNQQGSSESINEGNKISKEEYLTEFKCAYKGSILTENEVASMASNAFDNQDNSIFKK